MFIKTVLEAAFGLLIVTLSLISLINDHKWFSSPKHRDFATPRTFSCKAHIKP